MGCFKKPTVFLLGAGVSCPFGYPSAKRLKELICEPEVGTENFTKLLSTALAYNAAGRLDDFANRDSNHKVVRFLSAFKEAGMYSIDRWAEINQGDLDLVKAAKCAIALIVLNAEVQAKEQGAPVEEDWFASLWNYIARWKIESLQENDIYFVTFNYDRLLEYRLNLHIEYTYLGEEKKKKQEAFSYFLKRIVHVHGSLLSGPLEDLKNFGDYSLSKMLLGRSDVANRESLGFLAQNCARSISIAHEGRHDETPEIKKAREWIKDSERLLVLGFSYDERNVRKLGLDDYAKKIEACPGYYPQEHKLDTYKIVGTAKGLERGPRSIVETMFGGNIILAPEEMDAVRFCMNSVFR